MNLVTLVVTASIKGSILLLAAWAVTRTFRRMSAAARHLVWASALGGMLLMPLLMLVLPSIESSFVPRLPASASITTTAQAPAPPATAIDRPPAAPTGAQSSAARTTSVPAPTRTIDLMAMLPLLWTIGAALLLLRLALGTLRVSLWTKRARPVEDGGWLSLVQRLALRLGITRPVILLRSERACVPMTWGVVYPTVLLPIDADEWTDERRTIVLLHELAHVKRLDAFTQLVAQVAGGVFWFNPLVWLAAREMRKEREHACDDFVLQGGARASDYAHDLLLIARSLGSSSAPAAAALAMARRSEFEGRLLAILDPKMDRRSVSRARLAAATLGVVALALPLAALAPAHIVTPIQPMRTSAAPRPPVPAPPVAGTAATPQATKAAPRTAETKVAEAPIATPQPPLSTATLQLMARVTPQVADTALSAPRVMVIPQAHPVQQGKALGKAQGTPPDRETLIAVARAASKMTSSYEKAELLITIAKYYIPDDELRTLYLDAVATMTSDYDRSRTLAPLLAKDSALPAKAIGQVVAIAAKMSTDYEKANLIVNTIGDGRALAPETRSAMVAAMGSISSGYDRRRSMSAFVKNVQFDAIDATALIEMAGQMSSSYDKAEALIEIASRYGLNDAGVRKAYFKAAETITSATDYRRAMTGVLRP